MLRWAWVRRIVAFLTYQHRRTIRRRVEARLRAEGSYGDTVIAGPFKGLKYPPPEQWASCRFEKINATYEHELHALVERLAATQEYDVIINVGAAEGFYAVGLAMLFPAARILAYEARDSAANFCKLLACLNEVESRVTVSGSCTPEALAALHLTGRILIWMDIETSERFVLDPVKVKWLSNCDIVVEMHDCMEPGLTELIRGRFAESHLIEQITNQGLDYARYPVLRQLRFAEIDALVDEDRPGLQDWLYLRPKNSDAATTESKRTHSPPQG